MDTEHNSRQSFLGKELSSICKKTIIAIVGLGGGGSHIVQQLLHIGFENFKVFDPDLVEKSNLNRLIGAYMSDVDQKTPKIGVAERMAKLINSEVKMKAFQHKWQEDLSELEQCDLIFGCLDDLSNRDQLEKFARRNLIPYIDIGVDIIKIDPEPPQMAGQVFVSMPGKPCMRCMKLLRRDNLKRDGEKYGDSGPRAQVVWPNGVLASTAVGLSIQILTSWQGKEEPTYFLSYDGNTGSLTPDVRFEFLKSQECVHFSLNNVGPVF